MNTVIKIAATTLVSLAAFACVTANADDAVPSRAVRYADEAVLSRAVRYADLNLNTEQGVAALYRRIQTAAYAVCPGDEPDHLLARLASRQSCLDEAVARAVRHVNNDALSAYAGAKTGRPMTVQVASR